MGSTLVFLCRLISKQNILFSFSFFLFVGKQNISILQIITKKCHASPLSNSFVPLHSYMYILLCYFITREKILRRRSNSLIS